MFPRGSAQEFLALNDEDQFKAMEGQRKYATDFLLSSRRTLIGDDQALAALEDKVFWTSCVRLRKNHIIAILRCYPYADRMLAKYGMDKEEILNIFLNCMSTLLLGCEYSIELRNVLPTQVEAVFGPLDRTHEEHKRRMESFNTPRSSTPMRDTLKGPFPDMKED